MKKEGIKIRIDSKVKDEFKKICVKDDTSMSEKIIDFIHDEIKANSGYSVRGRIIKELVEMIIMDNLFEDLDELKPIITKGLSNLSFKTTIGAIESHGNITHGTIRFSNEDNNDSIIEFNVINKLII